MALLQATAIGLIALIIAPGFFFYFDITPKVALLLAGAAAACCGARLRPGLTRFSLIWTNPGNPPRALGGRHRTIQSSVPRFSALRLAAACAPGRTSSGFRSESILPSTVRAYPGRRIMRPLRVAGRVATVKMAASSKPVVRFIVTS